MASREENMTDDSAAAAAAATANEQTEGMQSGDEESGSGGEDDDDDEESEPLQPKVLPQRSTRGTRLTDMRGEGDDEFWQQEFFADEAEADVDYSSSDAEQDEQPDEVDSDFDEEEGDGDDDESEVQADKETKAKKSGAYVDPKQQAAKRAAAAKKAAATKARKQQQKAVPQKLGSGQLPSVEFDEDGFPTGVVTMGTGPYAGTEGPGAAAEAAVPDFSAGAASKKRGVARSGTSSLPMSVQLAMLPGRKSGRKSTVDSTLQTAKKEVDAERRRAKLAATAKPRQVFRLKTQEEQLADCAATEQENIASLEYLQRVEEEKKKELAPKLKPQGARVRLESKRIPGTNQAVTQLVFTDGQLPDYFVQNQADFSPAAVSLDAASPSPAAPSSTAAAGPSSSPSPASASSFAAAPSSSSPSSAKGLACAVTGLPARYLDPRTHLPYANVAAFAALRAKSPAQIAQLQAALAQRMGTVISGAATGSRRARAPLPSIVGGAGPDAGQAASVAASSSSAAAPAGAKKRKLDEVKASPPAGTNAAGGGAVAASPAPGALDADGSNTPAKKKARVTKTPAKKK